MIKISFYQMIKMSKILTAIKLLKYNREEIIHSLGTNGLLNWMSDKLYLSIVFKNKIGKKINWENPQSFNEKLQWLKLYNRKNKYIDMVDKYKVREYIKNKIGEKYLIQLLGVWENAEDITFEELPEEFVLKTTHDSYGVVICKNKLNLDLDKTKYFLKSHLKKNAFWHGREWPYKNVKPRIIAEKFMSDGINKVLQDYKVLCFNGKPKLIEVHSQRYSRNHTQDFYNIKWEKLSIDQGKINSNKKMKQPKLLKEMLDLSRILAESTPHVRVDWYIIKDKLYFGELTFFDGSGFSKFDNYEDDLLLGSYIKLPNKDKK